ncbi:MAG TPA: hypothetical protein VMP86_06285 [Candidatus Binatia bacterium]|nr:hypothetical protein [Candidatus Binatia bacterium]
MTTVQILQNVHVARQLASQHEAALRPSAHATPRGHHRGQVRHWLGRQLVRTGTWLTNERPMQPAQVG